MTAEAGLWKIFHDMHAWLLKWRDPLSLGNLQDIMHYTHGPHKDSQIILKSWSYSISHMALAFKIHICDALAHLFCLHSNTESKKWQVLLVQRIHQFSLTKQVLCYLRRDFGISVSRRRTSKRRNLVGIHCVSWSCSSFVLLWTLFSRLVRALLQVFLCKAEAPGYR